MKSVLAVFILLFIMFQLSFAGDEGKIYGKGVSLDKTTKISDILAKPDENIGKLSWLKVALLMFVKNVAAGWKLPVIKNLKPYA